MPILKQYTPDPHWPYILEQPDDDMSFNPFDIHGIGVLILGLLTGWVGAGILLTIFLVAVLSVLQALGVVSQ